MLRIILLVVSITVIFMILQNHQKLMDIVMVITDIVEMKGDNHSE